MSEYRYTARVITHGGMLLYWSIAPAFSGCICDWAYRGHDPKECTLSVDHFDEYPHAEKWCSDFLPLHPDAQEGTPATSCHRCKHFQRGSQYLDTRPDYAHGKCLFLPERWRRGVPRVLPERYESRINGTWGHYGHYCPCYEKKENQ